MYRLCLAVCFGLTLVWNLGCSPGPKGAAPAAKVKGTVSIDGKLIPEGEIHFSIVGYPPSVLKISDGSYSGEAPIGKNRVEVFIFVESPDPKYPSTTIKKNTTLDKYWGQNTTLDATVEAGGANEFNFSIKSK